MKYTFYLLTLLLCLATCQNQSPQEVEALQYAEKYQKNICQIHTLNTQNEALWGQTLSALQGYFPNDMPDTERKSMMKVKNASLIRMFDAYKSFDDNAKVLVDSMEAKDFEVASKLKAIRQENDMLQTQMDSLLMLLEKEGDTKDIQTQINTIKNKQC